ncbi:assimilatory sulfite reductase (NADPH) flavoprotein subunit [Paenibacillus motobuensis]|uniref:assimilatory sulfite reductase (NADPH) flavoprotein subunit n=1 Tax=Paenibacillus TaxID=44249 RepID=UPI00203E6A42|nr:MULTISPECIES: assimilatory sulfite reductase (NADPH) flavoprotein subunit [Paenibacillus]MCM3039808.1 assimilatory sulfite reductase (NADPH) flavoprotein subunit [Paenibacillus lutimineralis]MCM3646912.1 assimilatory sulfite reductase (NADPH) flavoprotein subunit [Paenibacillus motobuensis]
MVLQVTNSPFNEEQVDLLNRLLPGLNDSQRVWLSGYLTALLGTAAGAATPPIASTVAGQTATVSTADSAIPTASEPSSVVQLGAPASKEVTVLYGSQTGNAKGLAQQLSRRLEGEGFQVATVSMGDLKPNQLMKIERLLLLVSTHGEGEPPDAAISFYEFLHSKRAPKLEGLEFAVLALGDTSYEFFCQTGKDFDQRLEELGGKRIVERADCDVDFDETAMEWMNQVLAALNVGHAVAAGTVQANTSQVTGGQADGNSSAYSRTNPFKAEILENLNLNGRGSERETRHIELSLEGSGLQYQPGDCLAIYPENHPQLVQDILEAMGWSGEELVTINKNGEQKSLHNALLTHYEITVLTKPLLTQAAELTGHAQLHELVQAGHEAELKSYLNGRDLLDLIQDFSLKGYSAQEITSILRKIPPRQYSISSSPTAYPEEVHITVRTVNYESYGRERYGVCSTQLAQRAEVGEHLPIYIQQNDQFRLPDNPDTPIIMIGPGTGVAPFRAFLGEREEAGATGKSWLFYGDQHFITDFLYQIEWQRWLKDGVLTRMDVAFSRDTAEKVYVQHRMLEHSRELFAWLEEGAVVYVCGDEKRMAHDVQATLLQIIEREGALNSEQAAQYLAGMQQEKRYLRDVY